MSKTYSGKYIIKILEKFFGFKVVSQKGSHIKLEKMVDKGEKIITIVPNHKELQNGTLSGILNLAKIDKSDFLKVIKK